MSVNEKKISFLNNYFVYKKVHNVDAKSVAEHMIDRVREPEQTSVMEAEEITPKKLRRKLKLVN